MADASDTSKPLRILHLTAGSDAGGLSRYIYDLSLAMHERGHQVAVAGERGAWHWLFEKAPFPWIDAPMKGGFFSLRKAAAILSHWIEDHPVDVLHVHYRKCSMVGRQIQRHVPIPMLYTLHLSDLRVGWPWNYFTDFGDRTHVASVEARDWLIREAKTPAEKIILLPHGIDPARFHPTTPAERTAARQSLGLLDTDRVAAFVGRLERPKNEDWMLDLADQSRNRLPNLKVLLVGQGPNQTTLRRRIVRQHLESRVQLLGHRDPLPIYQAADALLLPSLREGFSLVCAEAMSTGIPVLRTRTAGTAELILENITGRSVPIEHDPFVATAIDFLGEISALKTMGAAASEHVRQQFTFQRQLEGTMQMYRALLEDRETRKR